MKKGGGEKSDCKCLFDKRGREEEEQMISKDERNDKKTSRKQSCKGLEVERGEITEHWRGRGEVKDKDM